MKIKSGFKTTEFWITVLSVISTSIVNTLVALEIVPTHDVNNLTTLSGQIITGLIAIASIVKYMETRMELKKNQTQIG